MGEKGREIQKVILLWLSASSVRPHHVLQDRADDHQVTNVLLSTVIVMELRAAIVRAEYQINEIIR